MYQNFGSFLGGAGRVFFVKILTKLYILHNDGAIFKDFLCKITDEECEQTHSPPTCIILQYGAIFQD